MPAVIYAVTVTVDPAAAEGWARWMVDVHMPEVVATGFFDDAIFYRHAGADGASPTFEIHYLTTDLDRLGRYQAEAAPALQRDHTQRYGGQASASRRVLVGP